MSCKIEKRDGKVINTSVDGEYELQLHPYEPRLYIRKDNDLIKVLHNAFDVHELPATFAANEMVKQHVDVSTFCVFASCLIRCFFDSLRANYLTALDFPQSRIGLHFLILHSYLLPAAGQVQVFRPLETCAAGRTQ